MSEARFILAKLDMPAGEATLHSARKSDTCQVSAVLFCNRNKQAGVIRLAVVEDGNATKAEDYLYFDHPVPSNDTFLIETDIRLKYPQSVRVQADRTGFTANLLGQHQ